MKIVLVGNYPADRQTSMLRYATFLQRELERRGHQVRLIAPKVIVRKLVGAGNRFGKWLGYIDKFVLFRFSLKRLVGDADVIHVCDHSNSMYLPQIRSIPTLITCHDALAIRSALKHYPRNPTGKSGRLLQSWIHRSLSFADRIIYVSSKTRSDFEQLLGIKVPAVVIRHALNWSFSPAPECEVENLLVQLELDRYGYIIHVGGNQWYKNRLGVLEMFVALRTHEQFRHMKLVMVGKPLTSQLHDWCRANGLHDVTVLENASNEQLRTLYTGAFALLFPSFEEGFGWPVLEAQACGCPVITSNRAPMTEIAGEGAKFVDPEVPDTILPAALECAAERLALIDSGFRNVVRFAPHEVVRSYERIYQVAIESSRESTQSQVQD
jgi:glycosyltransferase involved in cell wall biosynthesis